jgi:hypothetical protein
MHYIQAKNVRSIFNKVCQINYFNNTFDIQNARKEDNSKFDFEAFSKQEAKELKTRKPMVGKYGVFTPLVTKIKKWRPKPTLKNGAKPKSHTSRTLYILKKII